MTSRCWVPLSMTELVVSDRCVSAEERSAQRLEDDDVLLGGWVSGGGEQSRVLMSSGVVCVIEDGPGQTRMKSWRELERGRSRTLSVCLSVVFDI